MTLFGLLWTPPPSPFPLPLNIIPNSWGTCYLTKTVRPSKVLFAKPDHEYNLLTSPDHYKSDRTGGLDKDHRKGRAALTVKS